MRHISAYPIDHILSNSCSWNRPSATDCHRKKRYVQIFYHSHINQTISLKCSGPVNHPMEQLIYKFYVYFSNDIDFNQLFVTYPHLLKTNHFNKFVPCVFGVDDTFWYLAISIQIQILTCGLSLCFANIGQFCLICDTWWSDQWLPRYRHSCQQIMILFQHATAENTQYFDGSYH